MKPVENYTFPRIPIGTRGNVNKPPGLVMVSGDPHRNINKTNGKLIPIGTRGNVNKTNDLVMVSGDPHRNVNKTNGKLYISASSNWNSWKCQ